MKIERAQEALHKILSMFESGKLPAAVKRTLLKPVAGDERPCDKWSLNNRLLMLLNNTEDARGYKQWQRVDRYVKKGAKAFYILTPCTRKVTKKETDPETGEEKEEKITIIKGFREIPVFRYEDTDGKPLPKINYNPPEPPPLQEVAKRFGVQIIYAPYRGDLSYGFFVPNGKKKIVLHTHDIKTWFHELGHAVHATFRKLKDGQNPEQEIVAEVFAATMCELHGVKEYHQYSWDYVRSYSDQEPQKALIAIRQVLADVEKCLDLVFSQSSKRRELKVS
jgi:antirestriction protein ArdC